MSKRYADAVESLRGACIDALVERESTKRLVLASDEAIPFYHKKKGSARAGGPRTRSGPSHRPGRDARSLVQGRENAMLQIVNAQLHAQQTALEEDLRTFRTKATADRLRPEDFPLPGRSTRPPSSEQSRTKTPADAPGEPPAAKRARAVVASRPDRHWPRIQYTNQLQALLDNDVIEALFAICQQRQPRYVPIRPELYND